jgi:hypothetical protein
MYGAQCTVHNRGGCKYNKECTVEEVQHAVQDIVQDVFVGVRVY